MDAEPFGECPRRREARYEGRKPAATGRSYDRVDAAFTNGGNDGTLSTAGGVVLRGTPDRKFDATDTRTGKILWTRHVSSGVVGQPMTTKSTANSTLPYDPAGAA